MTSREAQSFYVMIKIIQAGAKKQVRLVDLLLGSPLNQSSLIPLIDHEVHEENKTT